VPIMSSGRTVKPGTSLLNSLGRKFGAWVPRGMRAGRVRTPGISDIGTGGGIFILVTDSVRECRQWSHRKHGTPMILQIGHCREQRICRGDHGFGRRAEPM
jgi:hypothetical protein